MMPRTPGPRPPLDPDAARRLVSAARARAAILVEGWSDQAALEAHTATAHFKEIIVGTVIPLLVRREREFYTPALR